MWAVPSEPSSFLLEPTIKGSPETDAEVPPARSWLTQWSVFSGKHEVQGLPECVHTHRLQIAFRPLQVQHSTMEQSKINKQFAKESSKGIFSHQQKIHHNHSNLNHVWFACDGPHMPQLPLHMIGPNHVCTLLASYDCLNKFYSCFMATVVGIVNGRGLGIDTCHGN